MQTKQNKKPRARKSKILEDIKNIDFSKINLSKEKKIVEKSTKEEKREEQDNDFQEQFFSSSRASRGFSSENIRAPVLEATEQEQDTRLETQVRNTPAAPSSSSENVQEQIYAVSPPKYSAADYTARSYQLQDFDDGGNMKVDKQVDVTGGRLMHRTPVFEERRAININAWESEHPFRRTHDGMARTNKEDYQVLDKKERREKTKLPFQE